MESICILNSWNVNGRHQTFQCAALAQRGILARRKQSQFVSPDDAIDEAIVDVVGQHGDPMDVGK